MNLQKLLCVKKLYIHRDDYELAHPRVLKLIHRDRAHLRSSFLDELNFYTYTYTFITNNNELIRKTLDIEDRCLVEYDIQNIPKGLINHFYEKADIIIDIKEESLNILKNLLYTLYKSTINLPLQFYNYVRITPNIEDIIYYDILGNTKTPVFTLNDFLYYRSVYNLYYNTSSNNWNVDAYLHTLPEEVEFKKTPIIIKDYCRRFFISLKNEVSTA